MALSWWRPLVEIQMQTGYRGGSLAIAREPWDKANHLTLQRAISAIVYGLAHKEVQSFWLEFPLTEWLFTQNFLFPLVVVENWKISSCLNFFTARVYLWIQDFTVTFTLQRHLPHFHIYIWVSILICFNTFCILFPGFAEAYFEQAWLCYLYGATQLPIQECTC